jgi:hypothetical protein
VLNQEKSMPANITIKFSVFRPLELRHRWLMQVLLGLADPAGKCRVSLRTIAVASGEHLSWVKRNVDEIIGLGYVTRVSLPGGGYVYTIAPQFLPEGSTPLGLR